MMTSEGAQSTENVSSLMRAQDVNHHGGVNKVKFKKNLQTYLLISALLEGCYVISFRYPKTNF